MTLPHDVISQLSPINADVGQAIVTMVERRASGRSAPSPPAEVCHYGSRAVIIVNPVRALKKVAGVQLVPIGNGELVAYKR